LLEQGNAGPGKAARHNGGAAPGSGAFQMVVPMTSAGP
jgi:hypothetical protein